MSLIQLNDAMDDIVNKGYACNVDGIYFLPDKSNFSTAEKQRVYSSKSKLIDLFWQHNDRDTLINKLHLMAEQIAGRDVDPQEPYIISRVVEAASMNESFRSHFDSHLVTIVIPIEVPKGQQYIQGELIVMPNKRKIPKYFAWNVLQKLFYGSVFYRYFLRKNFKKMELDNQLKIVDIGALTNLVFNGYTTLHCNLPIENNNIRRTLLIHYGDLNSKGVGAVARSLRNR